MDKLTTVAEKILQEAVTLWWTAAQNGTVDCMPHISAGVQTAVRWGLGYRKRSVPEFLRSQNVFLQPAKRHAILRVFALLGTADGSEETRRYLARQLQDTDSRIRQLALEALEAQRAPWNDAAIVNAVMAALEKDQITVRVAAARLILFWLDTDAPPVLRHGIEILSRRSKHVEYALEVAQSVTRQPLAGSENVAEREEVARQRVSLTHAEVLRYIEQLKDMDSARRARAARRLGQLHREGTRIYSKDGKFVVLLPTETRGSKSAGGRRQ